MDKNATMAIQEAGFVPFLTDLYTIDTYGLCNRELVKIDGTRGMLGLKLHWTEDDPGTRYVMSRKPDIIVIGPEKEKMPEVLLDRYLHIKLLEGAMHVYVRRDSETQAILY